VDVGSASPPAHAPVPTAFRALAAPGARAAPAPLIPGTAAALPVGEAALRQVLAAQGAGNSTATAVDLLRSVEALLRATAPTGLSSEEFGAAAARLVERQGLLARLSTPQPAVSWPSGSTDPDHPAAVDTRL
jgi:hypothetical protein